MLSYNSKSTETNRICPFETLFRGSFISDAFMEGNHVIQYNTIIIYIFIFIQLYLFIQLHQLTMHTIYSILVFHIVISVNQSTKSSSSLGSLVQNCINILVGDLLFMKVYCFIMASYLCQLLQLLRKPLLLYNFIFFIVTCFARKRVIIKLLPL